MNIPDEKVTTSHTQRILVADDDPYIRELLEMTLSDSGYSVTAAADGHELVHLAQQYIPDLILVDLMMPHMDGYEAIRQMRNDTRIAHVPMLILTARSRPEEVVTGFETGADDYIAKPFDIDELLARVRSHLRQAARQPLVNALSGLPGGTPINQELSARFSSGAPLALLHADLDNFKTFNDTYGFSRGDRAILLVSELLQEAIAKHGSGSDFIGHVGGDDFVVLTTPEHVDAICKHALSAFSLNVREFYQTDDWKRGYLSGIDRFGILRRFKLLSLSIGGASTKHCSYVNPDDMARVAAEMKHYAKNQHGNTYAIDQRAAKQPCTTERRHDYNHRVVIASAERSLRTLLRTTAEHAGYGIQEVSSVNELSKLISDSSPLLVLADAELGKPLNDLCYSLAAPDSPHIIVLSTQDSQIFTLASHTVTVLHMPLPLADVVACIQECFKAAEARTLYSK